MRKNISNSTPERQTPQRTCAVCRKVKGKREMVRLVRTPGGNVEIDISGKKEGRGAYLCRDWACWEKVPKGKQLEHAFRGDINRGDLELLLKTGKALLKE
jgi:predicted RNA-binding protein YlxR (DUF448 family)